MPEEQPTAGGKEQTAGGATKDGNAPANAGATYRGRMFEASRDQAEEVMRQAPSGQGTVDGHPVEIDNSIIANAVTDARILVSYLSRTYRPTIARDEALIPTVCLTVLHNIERRSVPRPGEEVFLWTFLGELSAAAHPATPDTIRNSTMAEEIGVKMVDNRDLRAQRTFWAIAVAIFLCTLLVGAYLALAEDAIARNEEKAGEYFAIVAGKYEGTRLKDAIPVDLPSEPPSVGSSSEDSPNQTTSVPTSGRLPDEVSEPGNKKRYDNAQWMRADALDQIEKEIVDNNKVLRSLSWWARLFLLGNPPAGDDQSSDGVLSRNAVTDQESINGLLSTFVFPVLSALLGAIVYIIRDTNLRRESIQLLTRQYAFYWPRVILSAISGIIVGWLSDADGGLFGQLSPVIVAFMIGYSTDVLFNVLDNVKMSLGGRNLSIK